MLKTLLLVLAVAGLHASPLRHKAIQFQHHAPIRKLPLLVQDQDRSAGQEFKAAPPELRRQGTEPSRRFLVDSYTGQLKEYISEMERRVGNLYEFRQGTEYLPATLSEHRTKYMMESMGKDADEVQMDVVATPIQGGGWVREAPRAVENQKAAPPELRRQGTEPSRRFLVDSYTGQLKDYVSEMERRVGNLYEFRQGTEYLPATLSEHRTKYMMESMGKDADYVPPSLNEFRQGSQNSRVTLVDVRTGKQLAYLSEMERSSGNRQLHDNRLDTEHSHDSLMELQSNHIVEETKRQEVDTHALMEFKHGIEYSQANRVDSRLRDPIEAIQNNEVGIPSQLDEFRRSFEYSQANVVDNHVMQPAEMNRKEDGSETDLHPETDSCPGEVISGKCYYFNPTPQTFSEAESSCKQFSPNGHLASVTTAELHARLVAMVSKANSAPVLTWLGGVLKEKQFRWTDGSSWGYSDWMPGHPDTATDRKTCLEMFRTDESWWTAVDCGLKRASVCSFSMTA